MPELLDCKVCGEEIGSEWATDACTAKVGV